MSRNSQTGRFTWTTGGETLKPRISKIGTLTWCIDCTHCDTQPITEFYKELRRAEIKIDKTEPYITENMDGFTERFVFHNETEEAQFVFYMSDWIRD